MSGKERTRWRRALSLASTIATVLLCAYLWPDRLGGSATVVLVRGTSMEPTYHSSDLVIVRQKNSYDVGDIVLYEIPEGEAAGQRIIHRLVGRNDDGTWLTRGDNSELADQFHLDDEDLVGAPVLLLPRAGRLLLVARNTYVLAAAAGMLAMILLWPRGRPSGRAGPRMTTTSPSAVRDVAASNHLWPLCRSSRGGARWFRGGGGRERSRR